MHNFSTKELLSMSKYELFAIAKAKDIIKNNKLTKKQLLESVLKFFHGEKAIEEISNNEPKVDDELNHLKVFNEVIGDNLYNGLESVYDGSFVANIEPAFKSVFGASNSSGNLKYVKGFLSEVIGNYQYFYDLDTRKKIFIPSMFSEKYFLEEGDYVEGTIYNNSEEPFTFILSINSINSYIPAPNPRWNNSNKIINTSEKYLTICEDEKKISKDSLIKNIDIRIGERLLIDCANMNIKAKVCSDFSEYFSNSILDNCLVIAPYEVSEIYYAWKNEKDNNPLLMTIFPTDCNMPCNELERLALLIKNMKKAYRYGDHCALVVNNLSKLEKYLISDLNYNPENTHLAERAVKDFLNEVLLLGIALEDSGSITSLVFSKKDDLPNMITEEDFNRVIKFNDNGEIL